MSQSNEVNEDIAITDAIEDATPVVDAIAEGYESNESFASKGIATFTTTLKLEGLNIEGKCQTDARYMQATNNIAKAKKVLSNVDQMQSEASLLMAAARKGKEKVAGHGTSQRLIQLGYKLLDEADKEPNHHKACKIRADGDACISAALKCTD